jgi:hypothetical protein
MPMIGTMALAGTIASEIAARFGTSIEHAWFVLGAGCALLIWLLVRRTGVVQVGMTVGTPGVAGQRGPAFFSTHGTSVTTFTSGKITVNGQTIDVDGNTLDQVHGLIRAGRKLDAIKRLREATALGLTEAKQIVDSLESVSRRADTARSS